MSEIAEALAGASTETLVIGADSVAVGKTIGELRLRGDTGVTVIAVVRDGHTDINPGAELRLQAEDIMVLLGSPQQIDKAIEHLNAS
jgi:K+/H+ antiporter YhaU regulatory subunit KhtT